MSWSCRRAQNTKMKSRQNKSGPSSTPESPQPPHSPCATHSPHSPCSSHPSQRVSPSTQADSVSSQIHQGSTTCSECRAVDATPRGLTLSNIGALMRLHFSMSRRHGGSSRESDCGLSRNSSWPSHHSVEEGPPLNHQKEKVKNSSSFSFIKAFRKNKQKPYKEKSKSDTNLHKTGLGLGLSAAGWIGGGGSPRPCLGQVPPHLSGSLERFSRHRVNPGETLPQEQLRRTRSLERNHRYLVRFDESFRYSREIGSLLVPGWSSTDGRPGSGWSSTDGRPGSGWSSTGDRPGSRWSYDQERDSIKQRYTQDPVLAQTRAREKAKEKNITKSQEYHKPREGGNTTHQEHHKPREGGQQTIRRQKRVSHYDNEATVKGVELRGHPNPTHHSHPPHHSHPHPPHHPPPTPSSARTWLHADHRLTGQGIHYSVRYIGCLEVNVSMKLLDWDERSLLAKECINRVCEEAGLRPVNKFRKLDKRIVKMLGEKPLLPRTARKDQLAISSTFIKLSDLDSGSLIHEHEMQNISFASGGDSETLDYIAYVAKDKISGSGRIKTPGGRACFVLHCEPAQSQEIITTIGQAFELTFKAHLSSCSSPRSSSSQSPLPPFPPLSLHSPTSLQLPSSLSPVPPWLPSPSSSSSSSH